MDGNLRIVRRLGAHTWASAPVSPGWAIVAILVGVVAASIAIFALAVLAVLFLLSLLVHTARWVVRRIRKESNHG